MLLQQAVDIVAQTDQQINPIVSINTKGAPVS